MDLDLESLLDWTPIRIYWQEGNAFVDWCFLGKERFLEPFHNDTIEKRLRLPFNLLFRQQTPLEFLGEVAEKQPGIAPKGFIFHVSRCGSTLISQMLAASERNIVVSEASIIDKIIRADAYFTNVSEEEKTRWLRWILSAMARRRFPAEENFFIKFDCWSVFDLSLIERAFPEVPWIFMYRNPVEVIVSNLRRPGAQMIPGAIDRIFPDLNLFELLQMPTEERFARTIAGFCRAALENANSPKALFVNYNELPEDVTGGIFEHFQVSFDEQEIEKIKRAAQFHAKTPQIKFKPDGAEKRNEAGETLIRLAGQIVDPFYEQLENLRLERKKYERDYR